MSAKGTVLKRVRQSRKANSQNKHYKSMMKSAIKNVMELTSKKDVDNQLKNAISIIDKVTGKGVIHKNTASRQKSRISNHINSLK